MSNLGQYLVDQLLNEIQESENDEKLLNESSIMTSGQADDGPIAYYPDLKTFNKISLKRAAKIGWEVVGDEIINDLKNLDDNENFPEYPNGPIGAVSYFPAGVVGEKTANKQIEIFSTSAYEEWKKHATRKMALAGYEVLRTIGDNFEEIEADKTSTSGKQVEKDFEKEVIKNLDEIWNETAGQEINEIPRKTLHQVDKFADKEFDPVDIDLTGKHFFDRLNDPRNKEEISSAELVRFFKKLGRNKKEFIDFLNKYKQIVATDKKTNINIPFMKKANKAIAKTVMRKDDFKTSNVHMKFENKSKKKDRVKFYKKYYENLTPEDFVISVNENKITIEVPHNKKKVNEKVKLLSKTLNVPRYKMPQIKSSDMRDYINFLKDNKVVVQTGRIPIRKLNMTQKDINTDKVKKLTTVKKSNLSKPIVVSNDNYILDGHHRTLALYNIDPNAKIKTISVGLPIKKLLSMTADYPRVFFKGINELIEESSKRLKLNIPRHVEKIHKAFDKEGKKLYIVGGAVRDAILGKKPKDFDLATDAKPDEVLRIADKYGFTSNEVGKAFGVVVVNGEEIATFRRDLTKGRRPDAVEYTDIQGDVRRRDLTINALFYDLEREEIVDLVGGIEDLKKKNIRTVGNAMERFDEDPLRKLRTLRFAGRIGGTIDPSTLEALQADPDISGVSPERIRDEFVKAIQTSKSTKWYLQTAQDLKMLQQILKGMKYNKDFIDENNYKLLISYLFRDTKDPQLIYKELKRLKYSHEESYDIKFLISLFRFHPDNIYKLKRMQENVSLTDNEIQQWGKLIGQDVRKFLNFELSVSGQEVMDMGFKGREIGKQIEKMEKEKFLNEGVSKSKYIQGLKDLKMNIQQGNHPLDNEGIVKEYYQNAIRMGIRENFIDDKLRRRINRHNRQVQGLDGRNLTEVVLEGIDMVLDSMGNLNESRHQAGIYKGPMKIDGKKVEIEVELYGSNNKNKTFLTKVVHVPKESRHRLQIGQELPIPARIFRKGSWRKVDTKGVFEDKAEGGLADDMSPQDIADHHGVSLEHIKDQLKMGVKVEMEHTDDKKLSVEIALDHLYEDPDYYTKLKTIEPEHQSVNEGSFKLKKGFRFKANKSFKNINKGYEYIIKNITGDIGKKLITVVQKGSSKPIKIPVHSMEEFYSKVMGVDNVFAAENTVRGFMKKRLDEHIKSKFEETTKVFIEDTEWSGVIEERFLNEEIKSYFADEQTTLTEENITVEERFIDENREIFTEMIIQETLRIISESGSMPGVIDVPSSIADKIVKDFRDKVLKKTGVVNLDSIVGLGSTRQILQKLPNAKKASGDLDLLAIAKSNDRSAVKKIADFADKQGWDHNIAFGNIVTIGYPYKGKKYQVDLMVSNPSDEDKIYDYMRKFKFYSDEDPNQDGDFILKGAHRSELAKTIVKAVGLSASNTGFKQFIWNDKFKNMTDLTDTLRNKGNRFRNKDKKAETFQLADILDDKVRTLDRLNKMMTGGDDLLNSRYPSSLFKKVPIAYDVLIGMVFSKEATPEKWSDVLDNKFNISKSINRMNKFDDVMGLIQDLLKERIITPRSVVYVFREVKDNFDTGKASGRWNRSLEEYIEDKFPFLKGRW